MADDNEIMINSGATNAAFPEEKKSDADAAAQGSDDDLESLIEQLSGMEGVKDDLGDMSVDALRKIAKGISEDMLDEMLDIHMRENMLPDGAKIERRVDFLKNKIAADETAEAKPEEPAKTSEKAPEEAPEEAPVEAPVESISEDTDADLPPAEEMVAEDIPADMVAEGDEEQDGSYDYLKALASAEGEQEQPEEQALFADGIEPPGSPKSKSLKSTESDLFDIGAAESLSPALDFNFNESVTAVQNGRIIKKAPDPVARPDDSLRPEEARKERKTPLYKKLIIAAVKKIVSFLPEPIRLKLEALYKKFFGRKKKQISQKARFAMTILTMLMILLVSSFFLLRNFRMLRELTEKTRVIVNGEESRFNYANFIFAGVKKEIGRSEITLTKLVADEYMSVFYFDKYIPRERYFPELRDDLGNFYCLYRPSEIFEDSVTGGAERTIYWFDGINRNANRLFLTLWDKQTNNEAVFEVDMDDYSPMNVKYLQSARGARTSDNNLNVVLEGGTFSSTMSTVVYKISDKNGIPVSHGEDSGESASGSAMLENTLSSASMLLPHPKTYKINDALTIGRLDFGPVRSLKNNARLTFSELYRYGEINETINAAQLFNMSDGSSVKFDSSCGQLVLEGMRKMDNKFVLVYHLRNNFGEKMIGDANIDLFVRTYTGVEIKLDSYAISSIEGGDMIFSYDSPNSIIDNYTPEDIYLKINSITSGIEDVTTDLSLSGFSSNENDANNARVKSFIVEAFEKRLSAKAGESSEGSVASYFSAEALSNASINELYAPSDKYYESSEAGIMAHTVSSISRNEFFAVAEVSWLGISNDEREHFYQTHELIIRQNGNNFVIINDKINESQQAENDEN